ncbi:hypothetical protein BDR26DRAFT_549232 [Obelidium mucronatum]|nr:hypothetical protein BDR26DRAFT_549232 [Obelidium mucronatum]
MKNRQKKSPKKSMGAWGLTTHVPHELITAIFSWIHPHKVHKFRSACRLINEILETSHFHVANLFTLFPKPNVASSLGTRILIKYAVFPDLGSVLTSWEIALHIDSGGRINYRQMDDGIIPIAKRLVRVLKLGDSDKVFPTSVWRQTGSSTSCMDEQDVADTGPHPFDPFTEVLILVPAVLKEAAPPSESSTEQSEPMLRTALPYWDIPQRPPTPTRSLIRYFTNANTCNLFHHWKYLYVHAEGCVDMLDLNRVISEIAEELQLYNVVVRRITFDASGTVGARLLQHNVSGRFRPFSLSSEALMFLPVELNAVAHPETLARWDAMLSEGRSFVVAEDLDSAMNTFNTLLSEKRDFYGHKDCRAYENVTSIASVFCHQRKYPEASSALFDYTSITNIMDNEDSVKVLRQILTDCADNPRRTERYYLPVSNSSLQFDKEQCIRSIKRGNLVSVAENTSINGNSLRRLKRYPEAHEIYRNYFSNLPPEDYIIGCLSSAEYARFSFDNLNAMEGLANVHWFQRRYTEAISWYQAVLAKQLNLSKPEKIVVSKNNLCEALFEAMDFETCLPYAIEAYHTECKACGRAGENCLDRMNMLGRCYFYAGKIEEALPLLQNYLMQCQKECGEDSMATFGAMRMIGRCLETTDPQQAHELYDKVEVKYYAEPGVNNENRLLIEWSRGSLWFQTGEFGKAESIWSKVLAERRKIDGEHPHVSESIHSLARLYDAMGYTDKATVLFREHIAILEGDEHHSPYQLTKALAWLAAHLLKLGGNEVEVKYLLDQADFEFNRVDTKLEGAVFLKVAELFEVASRPWWELS